MTPRTLAGLIRRLPKGAQVCVSVTLTTAGKGCALPVSRAAALRMVRRLYGSGQQVQVDALAGDLIIGG